MKTQLSEIKTYIENHPEGLTSLEAIHLFGCTRLSGQIHRLKKNHGMNIITEMVRKKNRYGGESIVALYKLVR